MQHEHQTAKQEGWKDWLWMALCCIPMVVIIILLTLGVWGLR